MSDMFVLKIVPSLVHASPQIQRIVTRKQVSACACQALLETDVSMDAMMGNGVEIVLSHARVVITWYVLFVSM